MMTTMAVLLFRRFSVLLLGLVLDAGTRVGWGVGGDGVGWVDGAAVGTRMLPIDTTRRSWNWFVKNREDRRSLRKRWESAEKGRKKSMSRLDCTGLLSVTMPYVIS